MSNFQSVILDCDPVNWSSVAKKHPGLDVHKEILSTTIALCNSHLFSSLNNRLLVLAGSAKLETKKFKNDSDARNITGSLEQFFRNSLLDANCEASSHYSAAISLSICGESI